MLERIRCCRGAAGQPCWPNQQGYLEQGWGLSYTFRGISSAGTRAFATTPACLASTALPACCTMRAAGADSDRGAGGGGRAWVHHLGGGAQPRAHLGRHDAAGGHTGRGQHAGGRARQGDCAGRAPQWSGEAQGEIAVKQHSRRAERHVWSAGHVDTAAPFYSVRMSPEQPRWLLLALPCCRPRRRRRFGSWASATGSWCLHRWVGLWAWRVAHRSSQR